MKVKLLFLMVLVAIAPALKSQTYFWESFDAGQMPPPGWTLDGLPAQWSISNSDNAGGLAPEGKFTYVQGTTTTRLVSPMVDLTGLTTVKFSFRYFYDWYSNPAPKIGVATRSHNGSWNTVWESTPTGNVGPVQKDLDISNGDVGQTEFQVCVYLNGNMYNLDYVFVDNMLLFNPLNRDAGLISLSLTPGYFSDPIQVKGTIMNFGSTTITSAEIDWQLNGGPVHTTAISGLNIAMQGSYDFTCMDLLSAPIGQHNLVVWIRNVNGSPDDYRANDTLEKIVNKVCYTVPAKPVFEEFTSSTCGPCAQFHNTFVPWCNQHEEEMTLIKYQMNWPSPGDPYYTAEGGVRRDYYGVGFVPDLYCNGANIATDVTAAGNALAQAQQEIGMMKVEATHTLSGQVITVNASVLPFSNFTGCRVHIVVMEKLTHNNVMSNGETSFEHVMMKMIPNAEGTTVNLTDRVPFNVTETVDLTGTHVEEWNDLIVGVFVQDQATKKIYQSTYSVENGVLNDESRLSSITYDGMNVPGFSPDLFTYEVRLASGTVIVPEVEAIPIDTNETVIIVPANELPGSTTIDVFAENLVDHNLYTVSFILGGVGVSEPVPADVVVFPNPAKGVIRILNATGAEVSVLSMDGSVLRMIPDFRSASLDLGSLTAGVYMLSVKRTDGVVIRKKIVVY